MPSPTLFEPSAGRAADRGRPPDAPRIRTVGLGKRYPTRAGEPFWALRDVSLEVPPGQALAVLGRNGSGKSTLLQIVAGTLSPTVGHAELRGRVGALLELGSGFSPELTGRQNVFVNGALFGLGRRRLAEQFSAICAFAELDEFIDEPVKLYSSGMFVRLAFAIQAILDPDVFIVDEALAVGDLGFQRKCVRHLQARLAQGRSVLVASHDVWLVRRVCHRAVVLDAGRIVVDDTASVAADRYLNEFALAPDGRVAPAQADNASHGLPANVVAAIVPRPPTGRGSGPACIVGAGTEDAAGAARRVFRQGQQMVVRSVFEAYESGRTIVCQVQLADASGLVIWSTDAGRDARVEITRARSYVDRVDVTLNLGPGRYLVSSSLWVTDGISGALQDEVDRFSNFVEIEIEDFDLGEDDPVPFWGFAKLPYTVRPIIRLRESAP